MKHSKMPLLALFLASSPAWSAEQWRDDAIVLANAEPKVLDASWSQGISFWVTVDDDGSERDLYASYLCLVLNEAGRPDGEFVAITVWDAATASSDNPRQLGKAACN